MLATVLPLALVVGLSPLPVLPSVILLLDPGLARAGAFLAGWLASLTLLVAVVTMLGGLGDPDPATDEGIGWVKVATGVIFLVMAAVKLLRRPRDGQPEKAPGWMTALGGYGPRESARLGVLLVVANPKVLLMSIGAGAEIAVLAGGPTAAIAGVAGFVVVGSIGVAAPFVVRIALGARADATLRAMRGWLESHGTALSVGVLLLLGGLLILSGLPGVM